jgi:teichuronic acid biosynthesis glycosyltransferase TuaG
MSKVDIILPSYNSQKYIEETINSIINQSFKDWNLIIIDDASTDESPKLIKKYLNDERISFQTIKKNLGAGFCRNLALRRCKSKYVAFIDSDDIWEKNKLKDQINFMDSNDADFSYTDFIPFTKTQGKKKFKKKVILPYKFSYNLFVKNTSICTSTIVIKRKKIGLTKFINTKICEDYFFKCKILKKCDAFKSFSSDLTFYRISKNSLQSSKIKNLYWVWSINKKYNKMNIISNIFSIIAISINSLKNYGFK